MSGARARIARTVGSGRGLCADRCGATSVRLCEARALRLVEMQQAEENRCLCTIEKIQIGAGGVKTIWIHYLQLILKECKVVTANALNNLFLCLLYKLVISIHLNINWIKI